METVAHDAMQKMLTPTELCETDVVSNIQVTTSERRPMFPERLWECVNDSSDLIRWSDKGDSIIVAEERFEREVMSVYPGLVAICSFANFRRQLRAYNFDWFVNDKGEIEFVHPYFLRGHPELVTQILTKRYGLKSSGGPPIPFVHEGLGEGTTRKTVRRRNRRSEYDEMEGIKNELNGEEPPKRKRRYYKRKERPRPEHYECLSPAYMSPVTDEEMVAPSMTPPGYRRNFAERPPAHLYCSCPWHCPVTWESYEAMMHGWTKGGPPPPPHLHNPPGPYPGPGYWHPQPPPHFAQLSAQSTPEKSAAQEALEASTILMRETKEETDETVAVGADQILAINDNKPESEEAEPQPKGNCDGSSITLQSSGRRAENHTVTVLTEGGPPHMSYPMVQGVPDTWRFHPSMGGSPYYSNASPYGGGPNMGPQKSHSYHQHFNPHMPYPPFMMEHGGPYPVEVQQLPVESVELPTSSSAVQNTSRSSMSSTADSDGKVQTVIYQIGDGTLKEMSSAAVEYQQTHGIHELQLVQTLHSPIPAEATRHQVAKPVSETITVVQPGSVSQSCVVQNTKELQPTRKSDEVSTAQLITNVGIQQQQMMVLMNQPEEEAIMHQSTQEDDETEWEHEEVCSQEAPEGSTWEPSEPRVEVWHEQHGATIPQIQERAERWMESAETVQDTAADQEVLVESPLDLSATEVTVVTMDQNLPVTLTAVVQEESESAGM